MCKLRAGDAADTGSPQSIAADAYNMYIHTKNRAHSNIHTYQFKYTYIPFKFKYAYIPKPRTGDAADTGSPQSIAADA